MCVDKTNGSGFTICSHRSAWCPWRAATRRGASPRRGGKALEASDLSAASPAEAWRLAKTSSTLRCCRFLASEPSWAASPADCRRPPASSTASTPRATPVGATSSCRWPGSTPSSRPVWRCNQNANDEEKGSFRPPRHQFVSLLVSGSDGDGDGSDGGGAYYAPISFQRGERATKKLSHTSYRSKKRR